MSLFDPKMLKNQDNPVLCTGQSERGSALIWILVMIGLVAALYFIVSQGMRTGEANLSREKTSLYVTEILDYAGKIKQAVQTLQINGCSDTDLSFDQGIVSGYNNAGAPTDNSCHVFHPNGGGITWIDAPDEVIDPSVAAGGHGGETYVYRGAAGSDNLRGKNATEPSLSMNIRWIKQEVCEQINEQLGYSWSTIPQQGNLRFVQFDGSYFHSQSGNETIDCDDTASECDSLLEACIHLTTQMAVSGQPPGYVYYKILVLH